VAATARTGHPPGQQRTGLVDAERIGRPLDREVYRIQGGLWVIARYHIDSC
jgi:hypothetical protein